MTLIKDLGCATNAEVLGRFLDLNGRHVVDAGCGGMEFTRQLLDLGASVLAIDPDPVQAQANLSAPLPAGLEFAQAGAEAIPAADQSVDGLLFVYSLHHVPADLYPQVFAEVLRVIKPGGFLYVIEPTACPLNDVMKLFHDEDAERALAQRGLFELAAPAFGLVDVADYHSLRRFESYEDFVTAFASRTFNSGYSEADVRRPAVREAFERAGQPDYAFLAPKRVVCLRDKKAAAST